MMDLDQEALRNLTARLWSDAEFKHEFLQDPSRHIKECGLTVPEGCRVVVVEDTSDVVHFVIPKPGDQTGPSDDELQRAQTFSVQRPTSGGGSTPCCDITVAPVIFDD